MIRTTVAAVGMLLALAASGEAQHLRVDVPWPEACEAVVWSKPDPGCWRLSLARAKPFVVRSVSGVLSNEGGGLWPDGVEVRIELASAVDKKVRHSAQAETPSGRFRLDDVRDGEYCLRVEAGPGWDCVEAHVIVSDVAPAEAAVECVIHLGE